MNAVLGRAQNQNLVARILVANFFSSFSGGLLDIAMPLFVFAATGSLTQTSLIALSSSAVWLVIKVFGSPQVDRLNRQKIIVISSGVRLVSYLLVPWLFATWGIPALMVRSVISASFGAVEGTAYSATMPILFGDKYQSFVSKNTSLSFAVQAIKSIVGGALVLLIGAANTIMIGAGLIAAYALMIGAIRDFDPTYDTRTVTARETSQLSYLHDGLRFALQSPVLRSLFLFWFIALAAVPLGVNAALPYITEVLGASTFQFGIISSLYGIGAIIGSLVAGKLKFPGGTRRWLVMAGLTYGTVNLIMFFQPGLIIFGVLWLIWGLAYGPEEVIENVAFIRVVPPDMQGRMYALMGVVMGLAGMVGTALVGPISDNIGPTYAMTLAGIIFIFATVSCFAIGKGGRILATINVSDDSSTNEAPSV